MSFVKERGKNGIWWYYWYESGKKHAKRLENCTPGDKVQAEIRKGEEDKKRYLGQSDLPRKDTLWDTFKIDFLADYPAGRTRTLYEYTFKRFEALANPVKVWDFGYKEAKEWKAELLKAHTNRTKPKDPGQQKPSKPLSPTTINMDIRNMRHTWEEAVRLKYAGENVFKLIEEVPTTTTLPRYLPRPVIQKAEKAARKEDNEVYDMMTVLKYTGIRLAELVHLQWRKFDLSRQVMRLIISPGFDPKDREEKEIGLNPKVVDVLRARWRRAEKDSGHAPVPTDYVFPGREGKARNKSAVIRLFNAFYERNNIAARGVHTWRHSFATHADLPDKVVQEVLGHADPRTTMRYRRVTAEELRRMKNVDY